jgi:hypothetical protein
MTASLQVYKGKRTKISILCQKDKELQTGSQNKERKRQLKAHMNVRRISEENCDLTSEKTRNVRVT